MTVSLAHYLKDFSAPQVADIPSGFDGGLDDDLALSFPEPAAPDPETIRREAHAEGYEAAVRDLEARFAREREELAEAHRLEIEALREAHGAETAEVIVVKVNEMAAAVSKTIAEQTGLIVAPLLSDAIAARAVADIADAIRKALLDDEVAQIVVRGPSGLFDMLTARMGEKAALLRHIDSADLDLTVEIDGSVLVTRISAWAASLKKVLE